MRGEEEAEKEREGEYLSGPITGVSMRSAWVVGEGDLRHIERRVDTQSPVIVLGEKAAPTFDFGLVIDASLVLIHNLRRVSKKKGRMVKGNRCTSAS